MSSYEQWKAGLSPEARAREEELLQQRQELVIEPLTTWTTEEIAEFEAELDRLLKKSRGRLVMISESIVHLGPHPGPCPFCGRGD